MKDEYVSGVRNTRGRDEKLCTTSFGAQPFVRWVPEAVSSGKSGRGMKLTTLSGAEAKNGEAILLSRTSSWRDA